MNVAYRITKPEISLLSELMTDGKRCIFPDEKIERGQVEDILKGLERKAYLARHNGAITIDRVIAGLVTIMLDARMEVRENGTMVFAHPRMCVLWMKEERSSSHYRMIPFPDRASLKKIGDIEQGGSDG